MNITKYSGNEALAETEKGPNSGICFPLGAGQEQGPEGPCSVPGVQITAFRMDDSFLLCWLDSNSLYVVNGTIEKSKFNTEIIMSWQKRK